jgi:hypothetical protein
MRSSRSIAALALAAFAFANGAWPRDNGKWGHDPETSAWFKSLKNQIGIPCCDYADGTRIEDPEWKENDDGSYTVFAKGEWHTISRPRVVTGTNRIGYAILWWPAYWPEPSCFLPGVRG